MHPPSPLNFILNLLGLPNSPIPRPPTNRFSRSALPSRATIGRSRDSCRHAPAYKSTLFLIKRSHCRLLSSFDKTMKALTVLVLLLAAANAFPLTSSWFSGNVADRLIKLGPQEYELVSENTKWDYKRNGKKFIDVTKQIPIEEAVAKGYVRPAEGLSWFRQAAILGSKQVTHLKEDVPVYNYPTSANHSKLTNALISDIDIDLAYENLSKFSSFYTRYYKLDSGFESANWLFAKIQEIVTPALDKVEIEQVHHDGWDQYSIVVRIPGDRKDKVVVGAHQDSANLIMPNVLPSPGADDDGSGTVTTLEALRLIIGAYAAGTFKPVNTLEFHYYSAEEGGLLGSIDVFTRYREAGEKVVGMLQQDMTGFTQGSIDKGVEPHFGLISDHTSIHLNDFIKVIVDAYTQIPYHETQCGYACSDHSSALENGYPSSFLIESEFDFSSKFIHSVLDTIDRLDWDHIKQHIQLTVGYAVELSLADNL